MTVPEAAIKAAAQAMADDWNPDRDPVLTAMFSDYSATALAAATPHLRAAWEHPIRELCEGSLAKASDPLAGRRFNGSPFPAVVRAKDVLALLEGGGE